MVLENLGNSLKSTIGKIKNSITVDRDLVDEIVKDIQRALLSSDVNVKLVLSLTEKIRKRAIQEDNKNLSKNEHLVTVIYEELSEILGGDFEFKFKEGQNRILLVGLYGQGKTTTTAKLGLYFKNCSKKVALISTDTYRPAAFEQLKQLSESLEISVFGDPNEKDATEIYKKFEKQLLEYEVVIIDSAGRDSLNDELIEEITNLKNSTNPTDVFFTLGADVGQTALKQAEMFKENVDVTGVIVTKLDGTGKGGGALSSCYSVDVPICFIGVGEKIEDLDRFNSKRFVSQLLGMGDLEGLLEKAEVVMDEDTTKSFQEKIESGEFNLKDLCEQMRTMKKMGSISKVASLIPGFGSLAIPKEEMEKQQKKIDKWEIMMSSMTEFEKENPEELNVSRLKRITAGSGCSMGEIRDMVKQYKQMKKMMSAFKDPQDLEGLDETSFEDPNQMANMMKKMGGAKMFKKYMRRR